MKKLAIFLLSLGISASILANNVGVVDARAVMAGYKNTAPAYKKLDEMRKKLENELNKEEIEIQKLQVEYNASPTDAKKKALDDRVKKFQSTVATKQKELADAETKEMQTIQAKIQSAIKSVATSKKMSQVFEANSLLYGGVNITQDVITESNK
ncbi:OmpH family outer membrane protein [Fusobacterium sp. PH5-44]|uniref:OmpH family outer membrane protein n=1 Tax=unclassified Fusobacterium TaxID=2648384 RepID=UPI003D1AC923